MLKNVISILEAKEDNVCLSENQKCGFTTSNPPIHHGDCCQGFECKYEVLGAGGRCANEGNISYFLP